MITEVKYICLVDMSIGMCLNERRRTLFIFENIICLGQVIVAIFAFIMEFLLRPEKCDFLFITSTETCGKIQYGGKAFDNRFSIHVSA